MSLEYEWTDEDHLLFKECFQCKKEKPKEFKTKTTTKQEKWEGRKGNKSGGKKREQMKIIYTMYSASREDTVS